MWLRLIFPSQEWQTSWISWKEKRRVERHLRTPRRLWTRKGESSWCQFEDWTDAFILLSLSHCKWTSVCWSTLRNNWLQWLNVMSWMRPIPNVLANVILRSLPNWLTDSLFWAMRTGQFFSPGRFLVAFAKMNFPLPVLTVPTQRGNTRTKSLALEARRAARSGTPRRATTTCPASEPRSRTDEEAKEAREGREGKEGKEAKEAKEANKTWVKLFGCFFNDPLLYMATAVAVNIVSPPPPPRQKRPGKSVRRKMKSRS